MKNLITILIITLGMLDVNVSHAKKGENGAKSEKESFEDLRKADFIRLLGLESNFQGVSVKYDKDKTAILGGAGIDFYGGKHVLFLNGSLGTSTNLTTLFSQDVLPTFSIGASYNILLPGTKYYYDGQFEANKKSIRLQRIKVTQAQAEALDNAGGAINSLRQSDEDNIANEEANLRSDAATITTNSTLFTYRGKFRKQMENDEIIEDTVYTFKRLLWVSMLAKYSNDQYGFIDYSRVFKSQQYDTLFQTFTGQIALNGYLAWNHDDFKWHWRPAYMYMSLYGKLARGNNIADIKKTTVYDIERSQYDSSSAKTRLGGKDQVYYKGDYYQFINSTIGARFLISPFKHLALDFSGEMNFIGNSDRVKYTLNNYSMFSAGFFVYTGSKDATKINLGLAFKRLQTVKTSNWENRIELVTSIPISSGE